MTRRVAFQTRGLDVNDDPLGDWVTQVTRDARIQPLKGGEGVQAQRLEGAQPVIITVRRDSVTRTIDNAWRAVDARDATQVWGVTSAIWNEAEDMIEVMALQRRGGSDA